MRSKHILPRLLLGIGCMFDWLFHDCLSWHLSTHDMVSHDMHGYIAWHGICWMCVHDTVGHDMTGMLGMAFVECVCMTWWAMT